MTIGLIEFDLLKDDEAGDALVLFGANVAVYKEEDGEIAEIFFDIAGANPQSNPFDLAGNQYIVSFYADDTSTYRIVVTSEAGSRTFRYREVSGVKSVAVKIVEAINAAIEAPSLDEVFPVPGQVESSSGVFTLDWELHFNGPRFVTLARASGDVTEGLTAVLPEIPLGQGAPIRIAEEVSFVAPSRTFTVEASWTDSEGAGLFTITESGVTTTSLGLVAGDTVSGGPLGAPTTISEIVSDSDFKTVSTTGSTSSGTVDIMAPAYSIDGVREFASPDPTGTGGGVLMYFMPLAASTAISRGEIKTGERYDQALVLAEARTYLPGQTLPEGWRQLNVIAVPVGDLDELGAAGDDPTLLFIGYSSPSAGDPAILTAVISTSSVATATLSGLDTALLAPGSRIVALAACRKGDGVTTGGVAPALTNITISGDATLDGSVTTDGPASANVVGTESCRVSGATDTVDTVSAGTFSLTAHLAATAYQSIIVFMILPESEVAGDGEDASGLDMDFTPLSSFLANDMFVSMAARTGNTSLAAPADSDERDNAPASTVLQACWGWHRGDPSTWIATPSGSTAQMCFGWSFRAV